MTGYTEFWILNLEVRSQRKGRKNGKPVPGQGVKGLKRRRAKVRQRPVTRS